MPRYRQLPDGTWLDEQFQTVTAPVVDPLGTGSYKRQPSPAGGPRGMPFRGQPVDVHAQAINGMGLYTPGQMGLHMRHGRNYGALGFLDDMSPLVKNILLIGTVVGGVFLTRRLMRKGAGRRRR